MNTPVKIVTSLQVFEARMQEIKYLRKGLTIALEMMSDYELEEWREAMEKFEEEE